MSSFAKMCSKLAILVVLFGFLAFSALSLPELPTFRIPNLEQVLQRHRIRAPEARYVDQFQQFLVKYYREYKTEQELVERFTIFSRNVDLVEKYNLEDAGKVTYELNDFSDLSDEEWARYLKAPPKTKPQARSAPKHVSASRLPISIDWRSHNGSHVTGVKYQGPCGSCWAFATAAAIESAVSINGGSLTSLSAQELLDCTPVSDKCGGGEPADALAYARDHGLTSARRYPYTFRSTECRAADHDPIVKIATWRSAESEEEMAEIVAEHGPMIVCANFATNKNRFYHSGIAEDPDCGTEPTHALIVVGYGPDYWILKNTYSKVWGEKGYMRVKRGVNWCGLNTEKPLLPIL